MEVMEKMRLFNLPPGHPEAEENGCICLDLERLGNEGGYSAYDLHHDVCPVHGIIAAEAIKEMLEKIP